MDEIIQALRQFRDERNWGRFHNPKDLAVSISIEAAELLENFQWRQDSQELDASERDRVADEAADVLLYTLLLLDRLGLDAKDQIMKKMLLNAKRFPVEVSFDVPTLKMKRAR